MNPQEKSFTQLLLSILSTTQAIGFGLLLDVYRQVGRSTEIDPIAFKNNLDTLIDQNDIVVVPMVGYLRASVSKPAATVPTARVAAKTRRVMCDVKINGIASAPEYSAWINLISPSRQARQTEQGITTHPQWLKSFKTFLADIGYRPHEKAQFKRIDATKGWTPNNTAWFYGGKQIDARRRRPTNWPLAKTPVKKSKKK